MKLNVEKGKAYRIEVEMPKDITQYALNFLKIYNNAREDRRILKLYNTPRNNIFVVVKESSKDDAVDWLGWFGEVVDVTEVTTITPIVPCDCTDPDFEEYSEAEFLEFDFE